MPTDEERIQIARDIRDLVHYSRETEELYNTLCNLLDIEASVVLEIMSQDVQEKQKTIEIYDHRNYHSKTEVETERVPLTERDYAKLNGIVEGLRWLRPAIQNYINRANEADKRKEEDKGDKNV